jgi:hypothetical protein
MLETIIVMSAVALAALYIIRRTVKAVSLKEGEGACGSCPMAGSCSLDMKNEACEKK